MTPTPPDTVGTEDTRLIVVRGNSASGKSSVATGLREQFGRNLAIIGQDNLRRTVLRERDRPGGANIGLIDLTARYALVHAHRGVSRCYYLDVPYAETVRRHATKPDAEYLTHVTPAHLSDWYREEDLLPDEFESVIGASSTLDDTIQQILRESGLDRVPPVDR
ncbi:kinase [Streptomyces sp. NPDC091272]|uniref:kinase n=1 Tax=Streptomyces sp. NPDC091272 TaxID=3365981 RepID=UPI00380E6444